MTAAAPNVDEHLWWLASRASGIVALLLITTSVVIGLGMATRMLRRRGLTPKLAPLHEHLSLAGLVAIAVHGITLLGDRWLHPGLSGISIPFAMPYREPYTGLGLIAGYLAAALGLSFYQRKRLGVRRWRVVHRAASAVYVLALVHTLGAGTDASTGWLRMVLIVSGAPVAFLLIMRLFPEPRPARTATADAGGERARAAA